MSDDEVNATRWADLSPGARAVLLGASPINVAHLRALVGRGYTDEVSNLTARGRELVEWARANGDAYLHEHYHLTSDRQRQDVAS